MGRQQQPPDDRLIGKLSYNNDDEAALLHHIIEQLSNMETHVTSHSPTTVTIRGQNIKITKPEAFQIFNESPSLSE